MRKFKKCLTLLLVLSMIVTTVPLDVFANETQGVQNVENKEGEYENEDVLERLRFLPEHLPVSMKRSNLGMEIRIDISVRGFLRQLPM